MNEAEWGIKRQCPSCMVWFYDFSKDPIVCPGCEQSFVPSDFLKLKNTRSDYASASRKVEDTVEDDQDAVIESAEELGDSEDIKVTKPANEDETEE